MRTLVFLIHSTAAVRATGWAVLLGIVATACATATAAAPPILTADTAVAAETSGVTQQWTPEVIVAQICSHCHSFDASVRSPNELAPVLGAYATRGPFNAELRALRDAGDPEWLYRWVSNAPAIRPSTQMPPQREDAGGRLPEAAVRSMVAYLLTLN